MSSEMVKIDGVAVQVTKGKNATVYFEPKRCIHSRACVLNQPDAFEPNVKGDWIHPDVVSAAVLMEVAKNCVSGAIRVELHDGEGSTTAPLVNTLRLRENGPWTIDAELSVRGVKQSNPRAALCRCGQSKNKPYCDNSHIAAAFNATGEPEKQEFKALEKRNGVVDIEPHHNGPLRVVGNVELISGTGRSFDKTQDVFLCRCGHSANKPYCDGSHVAAQFQAE